MTTVQIRTEVPLSELLQGVQQLDSATLEQFTDEVMLLRAKRRAVNLSKDETALLQQINRGLPKTTQMRFVELREKRDAATLTATERDELFDIIDQLEQRDVERLEPLAELAQLRGVSVRTLIHQLKLNPTDDA